MATKLFLNVVLDVGLFLGCGFKGSKSMLGCSMEVLAGSVGGQVPSLWKIVDPCL